MSESEKPKFNPDDEKNKEREISRDLTWGEGRPTRENHSASHGCINVECSEYEQTLSLSKLDTILVGVKKAPEGMQKENKHHAGIYECSTCFTQFWCHMNDITAKVYKNKHERESKK